MFTEDIFAYYGGKKRSGEQAQLWTGRAFVVGVTVAAHAIALELKDKAGIFEPADPLRALRIRLALAPVMWRRCSRKRSTNWGALASVLWVIVTMAGSWYLHEYLLPGLPQARPAAREIFLGLGDLFCALGSVTTMVTRR